MQKINILITSRLLRNFGLSTGGIFIVLFGLLIPFIANHDWPVWPWIVGLSFWIMAIGKPQALRHIYTVWMKIGETLGRINTFILLTIIYTVIFIPIGLVTRLLQRDPMAYRYQANLKSYRVPVQPRDATHMERPF